MISTMRRHALVLGLTTMSFLALLIGITEYEMAERCANTPISGWVQTP